MILAKKHIKLSKTGGTMRKLSMVAVLVLLLAGHAFAAVEIERVVVSGVARAWKYSDSAGAVRKVEIFDDATVTNYGATATVGSINWALDLIKTTGGTVYVHGGTYPIGEPLIIYSNTHLQLAPDATISLSAGANCNMIRNYAGANATRTNTMTTAAGSTTVTATGFTAADIGRSVLIPAAGGIGVTGSVSWAWNARITATTETNFTIDEAAVREAVDATGSVYALDTNIKISGGNWARGTVAGAGKDTHSIVLRHVDRFEISGICYTAAAAKWGVTIEDGSNGIIRDIRGVTYPGGSDGVHLVSYNKDVLIENVNMTTGDDTVALVAMDYGTYADGTGNQRRITIEKVYSNHLHGGTPHSIIKAISGPGCELSDITIRNVKGAGSPPINLFEDAAIGASTLKNIIVDGISAQTSSATTGFIVAATCSYGKNIVIRNLSYSWARAGQATYLVDLANWDSVVIDGVSVSIAAADGGVYACRAATGKTVKNLSFSNVSANMAESTIFTIIDLIGTVTRLSFTNAQLDFHANTTTGLVCNVAANATASNILISNVVQSNGRSLIDFGNGATVGPVMINNVKLLNAGRMTNNGNAAITFFLNNVTLEARNAYIYTNGGAITVYGSGVTRTGTVKEGFQRAAGTEVIHCINQDYPADISMLTHAVGDMAINTVASHSVGLGPVVSNGTNWLPLFQPGPLKAEAVSSSLSGASGSIAVNVPAGARILGVQLRVDTAITSGDGGTTWSAAYVNTPTTAICSGKAFTKSTKYNAVHPAYELTTDVVTITITPNSGTFSAGVVRGVVFYELPAVIANAP